MQTLARYRTSTQYLPDLSRYMRITEAVAEETYTRQVREGLRVVSCQSFEPPDEVPIRLNHPEIGMRVVIEPTAEVKRGWYRFELSFPPEGVVDLVVNISFGKDQQFWLRPSAVDRNHFAADIRVTDGITRIILFVGGSGCGRCPTNFSFMRTSRAAWAISIAKRAMHVLKHDQIRFVRSAVLASVHLTRHLTRPGMLAISRGPVSRLDEAPYDTWIRIFDENPADHRRRHEERMAGLGRRPLVSFLGYFDEINVDAIKPLLHTLVEQIYPHWQLLVAAPAPLLPAIDAELKSAGIDPGVVALIAAGPDVASTLNVLVTSATGEFIIEIPPSARLRPHALLEMALVLNRYPDAQVIYSDEDAITANGRRVEPKFKPAWSPEYLLAIDYIGEITLLRRQTLQQLGGWRSGVDNHYDHDLKLRITEQVNPCSIIHLAKILVHLASPPVPGLRTTADVNLLRDIIARRRCHAVIKATSSGIARLQYLPTDPPKLVSVLIPTRDRADLLEVCVRSILQRTIYRPFEIIIIDNDSKEPTTYSLFRSLQHESEVRIRRIPGEFNFSALNNLAALDAAGTLLALVNNDIEAIDGNWLEEMVGLAQRPGVGCVGAKLVYPDGRIQHAGVTIGLGGLAGHNYRLLPGDTPGYMNQMHLTHEVSAVTAACLVVRKSVYFEVGGLDEKELKVAFNDVDFCLKVRRAGYRNVWSPFAELVHHESASRGSDYAPAKAMRSATEANVIFRRWGQKLFNDPYYSPNLTYERHDSSVRMR
jgi:O-antigen biosynthesis protein